MPVTPAIKPLYDNIRFIDIDKSLSDYQQLRYTQNNILKEISVIKKSVLISCADEPVKINNSLNKEIQGSKYLLDLKDNWDDEGAKKINVNAYKNSISFLTDYSERVYDLFGVDLIAPSIAPVKDGSVDLEWNLDNSYLLINFTGSKEGIVYYYLAQKEDNKIMYDANGQIDLRSVSNKFVSNLAGLS